MRSFWLDPFIWIHLSGLITIPVFLGLCLLGLAVGAPLLSIWWCLPLVALPGVLLVLLMQLYRPFYIFCIPFLAIKPEQLLPQQRRILSLFKARHNILTQNQKTRLGFMAPVLASIVSLGVLWQIYLWVPMVAEFVTVPPQWQVPGLVVASFSFIACHLFVQVPVSVAEVMLTSEDEFAVTQPYPVEKISEDFTILGFQVNPTLLPIHRFYPNKEP